MSDASLLVKIGSQVDVEGIKKFGKELDDLATGSVAEAQATVKRLKTEIINLDATALNSKAGQYLTSQYALAKKELEDLSRTANVAAGASSNVFGGLYQQLRQIAYILPGIGVAGLLGGITSGLINIVSGDSPTKKELEATKKAAEEVQKSIEQTIGTFAKESGQVDSLVTSLKRGNLTRLETKSAIEELQKISPEYFGNLNKENLSIQDLTKSYAAYNAQVINAIETQLKMKEITDIIQQRLDFEHNAKDASAEFQTMLASGKSLAEIAKIANDRINEQSKANINLLQSEKGRYASAKDLVGGLGLEAGALLHIVQLRQQEEDILGTITNYGKISLKDVQATADAIEEIQKAHISFQLAAQQEGGIQSAIAKAAGIDNEIKFTSKPIYFTPDIQAKIDKQKLIDSLNAELTKSGQEFATEALVAISTGIGAAFGGGKNPFAGFTALLGNALEQLGKQLIVFSGIFKGIKIAIENAIYDPTLLAVAGVAAIVAGAALRASVGKGIHAFAEGGLVTGPTVGLVGEAGPEVIFPLNKINQFVSGLQGSGQTGFVAETRVQGNDLRILINRANKNQGYVG